MENTELNNRIEKTMASLDGLKRAEANPFLYTRVMERMKKPSPGVFKSLALWQMTCCLLFVLGLNLAIGFYVYNNEHATIESAETGYFNNNVYTY